MSEQAIRFPEALDLPDRDALTELLDALSGDDARRLSRDIASALTEAKELGDLRPLQNVITAWFRSRLFARRPGVHGAIEWANSLEITDSTGKSLNEALEDLRLPVPKKLR